MRFLCDNLRAEKIFFEYKLRHLMARVRYSNLDFTAVACHFRHRLENKYNMTLLLEMLRIPSLNV